MAKVPETLPVFYSVKQVAEKLGLSAKTIRRWIDVGELPVHRLGRSIRITESDLITFLKLRREM